MIADFSIGQGALLPAINTEFHDQDGAVDLSAATVRFQMKHSGGGEKIDAAATVVDGPAGAVRYLWAGTDTDTPGWYVGVFEATIGGKKLYSPSVPYQIRVREAFAE